MSRGDYWNTNQFQKFLATIQMDTVEEPVGTTNGWGYVDEQDEFFGAVLVETKKEFQEDDDE